MTRNNVLMGHFAAVVQGTKYMPKFTSIRSDHADNQVLRRGTLQIYALRI